MIDRYTKAVLTVIAVCLCLLTVQNFDAVPTAQADSNYIYKIAICDMRNSCARVRDGALATIAK